MTNEIEYRHFLFVCIGSMGDVMPSVCLAAGLQKHGHKATIATYKRYEQLVLNAGLSYYELSGDLIDTIMTEKKARQEEFTNPFSGFTKFASAMEPTIRSLYHDADNESMWMGKDCVVLSCMSVVLYPDVVKRRIPFVYLGLQPLRPNYSFSPPLLNQPAFGFHWIFTRGMWFVQDWAIRFMYLSHVNTRLKQFGMMPLPQAPGQAFFKSKKIPQILTFSPTLLSIVKPEDRAKYNDIQVGYFAPPIDTYTPPDDMANFLNADGKMKPIYFGFGSMSTAFEHKSEIAQQQLKLWLRVLDGIAQTYPQVRAFFCLDKTLIQSPELVERIHRGQIYATEKLVPHRWLFPRCLAAVHHGGAGTSHAALEAGIPSVVVAYVGDQRWNGSLLMHKGICSAVIRFKDLAVGALVDAVLGAAFDDVVLDQAKKLGDEVRTREKDAVNDACEFLREYFNKKPGGHWEDEASEIF
ncbi:uncharacterized protein VTP21DRAFT_3044 [Calcarisporiella thermophila]|uniref:uncharacterized protein n=1 Tax=Calcarisporiella thermophila TaxID=911321 RepID=UPI003743528F